MVRREGVLVEDRARAELEQANPEVEILVVLQPLRGLELLGAKVEVPREAEIATPERPKDRRGVASLPPIDLHPIVARVEVATERRPATAGRQCDRHVPLQHEVARLSMGSRCRSTRSGSGGRRRRPRGSPRRCGPQPGDAGQGQAAFASSSRRASSSVAVAEGLLQPGCGPSSTMTTSSAPCAR